jgi:hypothetical protein
LTKTIQIASNSHQKTTISPSTSILVLNPSPPPQRSNSLPNLKADNCLQFPQTTSQNIEMVQNCSEQCPPKLDVNANQKQNENELANIANGHTQFKAVLFDMGGVLVKYSLA